MTIRTATPDDAPQIAAIYAPVVANTAISFEAVPPTAGEMRERIETILRTYPWLVAEDNAGILGYAYGSRHRDREAYRFAADVSVYVAERARRTGIGSALYRALFPILSDQGYQRLYAGVMVPNPASEALHRAVGFEEIGTYRSVGFKLGKWHDVRWYGLALRNDVVPSEPIPFSQLSPRA